MREQVCSVLRGSVDTWQYNLQAKWGDPRAYEAEQVERLKQDARLAHDLSRRNNEPARGRVRRTDAILLPTLTYQHSSAGVSEVISR